MNLHVLASGDLFIKDLRRFALYAAKNGRFSGIRAPVPQKRVICTSFLSDLNFLKCLFKLNSARYFK